MGGCGDRRHSLGAVGVWRAAPLAASLPAVNVSEPIVGSVLGIVVLGETLNTRHRRLGRSRRVGRGNGRGDRGSGSQPGHRDPGERREAGADKRRSTGVIRSPTRLRPSSAGAGLCPNSSRLAEAVTNSPSWPLSWGRLGTGVGETGQLADRRTIRE